jgi:RNA polymerase sigma factor (sigma-70 family)
MSTAPAYFVPLACGNENPTTHESGRATQAWVGQLLGEIQQTEIKIARHFNECRGLGTEQLEDLYQEATLTLIQRTHANEDHVRGALRIALKFGAQHLHRDERRRSEILNQNAAGMQLVAERQHSRYWPEEAALRGHDRLVARKFLDGLDDLERRVFWLESDGKRYRAIAASLGIPPNVARKACRSCERKRRRFELLCEAGRTRV